MSKGKRQLPPETIRFMHTLSQMHMEMKHANDPVKLADEILSKFDIEEVFDGIETTGQLMQDFLEQARNEKNSKVQAGRWVFATSLVIGIASLLDALKPDLERMVVDGMCENDS